MRGRAKRDHERAVILAHQIEVMARQKVLRGVSHYLRPRDVTRRASGASDVLAMFRRIKAKQDGKNGA